MILLQENRFTVYKNYSQKKSLGNISSALTLYSLFQIVVLEESSPTSKTLCYLYRFSEQALSISLLCVHMFVSETHLSPSIP